MFKNAAVLFLYAESPLHFGSGTSLGAVDLPIQRERHTQFPIGQASGVKGAMRDVVEQLEGITAKKAELRVKERKYNDASDNDSKAKLQEEIHRLEQELRDHIVTTVFGPERDASAHGGALAFRDARVLLFPVRSLKGVFAYITCPTVIEGFKRDLKHVPAVTHNFASINLLFDAEDTDTCAVSSESLVVGDKVVLEDFAFTVKKSLGANAQTLANTLANAIFPRPPAPPGQPAPHDPYHYWRTRIQNNLVVLHDDAFRDFVQFSTEVLTRIKISDETGTVAQGALFTEEHLPSETVLYTLALATDAKRSTDNSTPTGASKILETFKSWLEKTAVIQCGGDETVGRGLVYVKYWPESTSTATAQQPEGTPTSAEHTVQQGGAA
jgi:CRISPR-associated protein Cmr4